MAQDGIILTEAQLRVLENRKNLKEAHGEIETEHPGGSVASINYAIPKLLQLIFWTL